MTENRAATKNKVDIFSYSGRDSNSDDKEYSRDLTIYLRLDI